MWLLEYSFEFFRTVLICIFRGSFRESFRESFRARDTHYIQCVYLELVYLEFIVKSGQTPCFAEIRSWT